MKLLPCLFASIVLAVLRVRAQVNTGSTGADGALDFSGIPYATNIVIDMHDHPTGIYHYTSVNIPANVTVSFIPNANNTPVVWLVQSNVIITGSVDVSGRSATGSEGGIGGPSGWLGGSGGANAGGGQGPGGGLASTNTGGGGAQFNYGNSFLVPLLGGSGGGGGNFGWAEGGGGGGGALLIAASSMVALNGYIISYGGEGANDPYGPNRPAGGGGSGGAVRVVAAQIIGTGWINTAGGRSGGGDGRVRFDTFENRYAGGIRGNFSQGFQPIIIPTAGQLPTLRVTSVGGVSVSPSPTGVIATPDAIIAAQQNNPIPVVVQCSNVPLNSQITVTVKPATGAAVSATGANSSGTTASSTATISINIPRGGGLIYATATTAP